MSMYNMLFGTEPTAEIALKMLNITSSDIPRFRDAFFTWSDDFETVPVIVIHTRTGGGNRPYYESKESLKEECPDYTEQELDMPYNSDLQALSGYLYDEDSNFDATYADFYFSVPEAERQGVIDHLKSVGKPLTPGEKMELVLASLGNSKP